MKNKKIILGLGTITALGAMSVGFIACVKKKEIEDMNLSKLTKKEVEDLLKNVSTLTKEQVEKLINEHPAIKSLIGSLLFDFDPEKDFTNKVLQHLSPNKEKIESKINIGHFKRNSKVQDVINKIKELIKTKANWEIVEDSKRDDFKEEKNGKELTKLGNSLKFKFKTKLFDHIIETDEIEFNFAVGRSNFKTLIGDNKTVDGSIDSIEKLIKELNKREKFKNINLTLDDLKIVKIIEQATIAKEGKIKVKVKDTSIKLEQDDTEFEFKINKKKSMLNQSNHLSGLTLDWSKSESEIKKQILDKINAHDDFKNNKLSEDNDLDIVVIKPNHLYKGLVTITPKKNSGKVKGQTIKFEQDKLSKISLEKQHVGGDAFKATNDTTKVMILNKLKEHADLKNITIDDFIFEITKATKDTKGIIKIKATTDSIICSGEFEIHIDKLTA